MRTQIILTALVLSAVAMGGCQAANVFKEHQTSNRDASSEVGTLIPPPAGDNSPDGWTTGFGGYAGSAKLNVAHAQADAKALQGKLVNLTVRPTPAIVNPIVVLKLTKARLPGTLRQALIDARHPTGWVFATKLHHHDWELPIDLTGVMPAAAQLAGKQAVFTGSMRGTSKTGLCLVADTLEPG